MKHLKKLASVLLALVMAAALMAPAFAATTVTVRVPEKSENHTYDVYQIFTGEPEGDRAFNNLKWGTGIAADKRDAMVDALKAAFTNDARMVSLEKKNAEGEKDDANGHYVAGDVAMAINSATNGADNSPAAQQVRDTIKAYLNATSDKTVEGDAAGTKGVPLEKGWYMILDTDKNNPSLDAAYNLLRVNDDVQMQIKEDKVPKFKKEVQEYKVTGNGDWGNMATYPAPENGVEGGTSQPVKFKLTGGLPNDFNATAAPEGRQPYKLIFHDTLEADKFETFALDKAELKVTVAGKELSLTNGDYRVDTNTEDGCSFEVYITDVYQLMEKYPADLIAEKIKAEGAFVVEYTAFLTSNADLGGDGNMNTAKMSYGLKGETNEVQVPVFTFKFDLTKLDGTSNERKTLTGAAFTLYTIGTDGTFSKEVKAYPKRPTDAAPNPDYKETSEFTFSGLPEGRYKLVETEAPEGGFNPVADIYFEIEAEYNTSVPGAPATVTKVNAYQTDADGNRLEGDSITATFEGLTTGFKTEIKNYKGAILPETGGIGTTIFYIVGGVLVVGAVVLLITKRRAGADEE